MAPSDPDRLAADLDDETPAAVSASKPAQRPGRYDSALRRQSQRRGRQKGCFLYIPADELERAGFDPEGPPPFYRVWGSSRGGLFVRLYKEA
jgi:hypothetical protein